MSKQKIFISILLFGLFSICHAQQSEKQKIQSNNNEITTMSHQELFNKLQGQWQGTVKTWFEPGKLADESSIKGKIESVLDGKFLRHSYKGSIQGKARSGEELVALNSVTKSYEVTWIDSFHMNYAILISKGEATKTGFDVFGKYDVGAGIPQWGWRTNYQLIDDDHVTITAYNVTPEGQEAKAVETVYQRVNL